MATVVVISNHHHYYHPLRPLLSSVNKTLAAPPRPIKLPSSTTVADLIPIPPPPPLRLTAAAAAAAAAAASEEEEEEIDDDEGSVVEVDIDRVADKRNRSRIRARIRVRAGLETVWRVLTDYEGLSAFIPSLAVSQVLHKEAKFARLYQVGKQDLPLGFKFDAKGVLDCYEGDVEPIPSGGRRRDIHFKMIEGDFQTFEGRWSIEQIDNELCKSRVVTGQELHTTLSYIVEFEPKLWLPVRLLEGRVCREVKTNLLCVRNEAQRVQSVGNEELSTWENGANNGNLTC